MTKQHIRESALIAASRSFRQAGIILIVFALFWSQTVSAQNGRLKIYGYVDAELEASKAKSTGGRWSFDQHHFNLITVYNYNAHYRIFGEIDWEHGPTLSEGNLDGKIYLAQAFIEYKHTDALLLRVGKFVTPFGIYNELHDATPTFISTKLPEAIYGKQTLASGIKDRVFAQFGTGIQVRGQVFYRNWEGAYRAYLTNGRGAEPGSNDDNTNKGVGARAFLTPPKLGMQFGVSFYGDRHGLNYNARQWSLAGDVVFDYGPLHMEAEILHFEMEQLDSTNVPNNRYRSALGCYLLSAITIHDRYTPFRRFEYLESVNPAGMSILRKVVLGINTNLTPGIVLKNEFHLHLHGSSETEDIRMFVTSVAAAF